MSGELRRAIENGVGQSERAQLYERFRGAQIWLAADEEISHLADYADVPLEQVRFAASRDKSGDTFLLGFSEEELGLLFRAGAHPLLSVRGERLVAAFVDLSYDGLLLDAGQTQRETLYRRELLALASGRDPLAEAERVVADGLGPNDIRRSTARVHDDWSRQLLAALAVCSTVEAAYLIDLQLGGVMAPRLIVEFSYGTDDEEDATLIASLRRNLGRPFDIMFSEDPVILRACRNQGRRLY